MQNRTIAHLISYFEHVELSPLPGASTSDLARRGPPAAAALTPLRIGGGADKLVSGTPKRARVEVETPTVQKKKQAMPRLDDVHASVSTEQEDEEEEEKEDQQGRVDRALAASSLRSSTHTSSINVGIFGSDEWDDVLEAINDGPVEVLSLHAKPATLLARVFVLGVSL